MNAAIVQQIRQSHRKCVWMEKDRFYFLFFFFKLSIWKKPRNPGAGGYNTSGEQRRAKVYNQQPIFNDKHVRPYIFKRK